MNEPMSYTCEHSEDPNTQCKWCLTKTPVDADGLCYKCFEVLVGVRRLSRIQAARTALWHEILTTPVREKEDAVDTRPKTG